MASKSKTTKDCFLVGRLIRGLINVVSIGIGQASANDTNFF